MDNINFSFALVFLGLIVLVPLVALLFDEAGRYLSHRAKRRMERKAWAEHHAWLDSGQSELSSRPRLRANS